MSPDVEIEITPTEQGRLIRKRTATQHPVGRVYAVLGRGGNTDGCIEKSHGR